MKEGEAKKIEPQKLFSIFPILMTSVIAATNFIKSPP